MTKRAKAIRGFVDELQQLALNGTALKLAVQGKNPNITKQQAERILNESEQSLQTHLVTIVERNEEQAEALKTDLGLVKSTWQ